MVALFVLLLVVLAVAIDFAIQVRKKKYPLAAKSPAIVNTAPAEKHSLRIPKGIFFHPGHTWGRILVGEAMQVGIDDFVQHAVGAIDRIAAPTVGTPVKQGETLLTLHQGENLLKVVSPICGTIGQVNQHAIDAPALVNENPYRSGWLCVIKPEQLSKDLSPLMIAEEAIAWSKREIVRLHDFVVGEIQRPQPSGATLVDGGVPVSGLLRHLEQEGWSKFEREFL